MGKRVTRRDVLRGAGLLGLGGLVWSAAVRPGGAGRLPCERCPALRGCTVADSLQARDSLGVQPDLAAAGGRRLCETDAGSESER